MRWPWIGNYPQEPEDINYNPGQKCWDTKQVLQSPSYNVENRLFCPLLLKTRATFSNIMIRGNGEYVIQLKCQNYVCLGLWTSTQKPPTLGFNRTAVYKLCRSISGCYVVSKSNYQDDSLPSSLNYVTVCAHRETFSPVIQVRRL